MRTLATVHGYDRYTRGTGEMRHRLCGAVTVMAASGPDMARSAAARQTSEIIWAPAAPSHRRSAGVRSTTTPSPYLFRVTAGSISPPSPCHRMAC